MAEFYTDFVDELEVLTPSMLSDQVGAAALNSMAQRGFVMTIGLTRESVPDLARIGAQPHIVEFAHRDATRRFPNEEAVSKWLSKRRFPLLGFAVEDFTLGDTLSEADMKALDLGDLTMVDYGWFGPEQNKHIAGADVTTAYRVAEEGRRLSRERRFNEADKFKLGLPLGQVLTAVAIDISGVEPAEISLETFASNRAANAMYDLMHFREDPNVPPIACVRPTLKAVGEEVDGKPVYFDELQGGNMVEDFRLNKRYDPTGELTV